MYITLKTIKRNLGLFNLELGIYVTPIQEVSMLNIE